MDLLLLIGGPAVLAGLVAIAVTMAVERWGGIIGGLLGTVPTTIVPASWGIWAASQDPQVFAQAMGAVPVGMLVDAGFLYLWRVLPPRLPATTLAVQLSVTVAITLVAWAGLAGVAVASLHALTQPGGSAWWAGAAAWAANVVIGVWACRASVPAPAGRRAVPWAVLVGRGGLAALAIAVSTLLAHVGDGFLAGVASAFPAIFLTTMVGLWLSQGLAVPAGAVGPMMLGASSVGAFSLLAALVMPWVGPGPGAVLAWVLSVVLVTLPALGWLRGWRSERLGEP